MLPDREGRFKAAVVERGVGESGQNNLATFACEFKLLEELVNGEFLPLDQDFEITGYFFLEKKDGSLNTSQIDALKRAFGWDGRDPFWLQDADMADRIVQVKLAFEEYEGKQKLKVRYVDAEDATGGGVRKADDQVRKSMNSRLGSKFRALAGGTPAPAPKPAGKPTAPAASKPATKSAPPSAPPAAQGATVERAWEVFAAACSPEWTQAQLDAEWFRVLGELFPGKKPEQLTPVQWAHVVTEGPKKIVPF